MTRYVGRDIRIIFEYIYNYIFARKRNINERRNELFPHEITFPFNYERQKINIYSKFYFIQRPFMNMVH